MQTFTSFVSNPWVRAVGAAFLWFGLGAAAKAIGHIENPWAEAAVDILVNVKLIVQASPLYVLIPRPKDDE